MFGRKCFIKRDENNLGKFDSCAYEGILLRYCIRSKGYKCYNKWKRKIEDCINVIVDEVGSQLESYKRKKNSNDEESLDLRSPDVNEIDFDNEGEKAYMFSRPKTPSKYVQKENPKSQILGDQREGVQTRRKLVGSTIHENLALLSQIKPKNLCQAC